ncbi:MAG: hypothetical protein IKM25_08430 [Clostridia bacterium]|nr:hypothetical protein [Clostridia bacterium]
MKRFISIILCAILAFTAIPAVAFAAEEERSVVDSGICGAQGDNITWTLYDDGELVIGGEGEMKNYQRVFDVPWFLYYGQIKVVTVEEGVTSIGHRALVNNGKTPEYDFSIYYLLNLPKSLEKISANSIHTYAKSRTLAISYAGSEADWEKIKFIIYDYSIEYEDETWYEQAQKDVTFGPDFTKENEHECVKMFFNGEKPDAYCKIYCEQDRYSSDPGDEVQVFAHYYPYKVEGDRIIWYMILDGEESVIGEKELRESNGITVTVPERKKGELYVRAEVVDEAGNTVLSSGDYYIENNTIDKRTFKEKVKDFFEGIAASAAWYAYMMNLLALLIGMSIFG